MPFFHTFPRTLFVGSVSYSVVFTPYSIARLQSWTYRFKLHQPQRTYLHIRPAHHYTTSLQQIPLVSSSGFLVPSGPRFQRTGKETCHSALISPRSLGFQTSRLTFGQIRTRSRSPVPSTSTQTKPTPLAHKK